MPAASDGGARLHGEGEDVRAGHVGGRRSHARRWRRRTPRTAGLTRTKLRRKIRARRTSLKCTSQNRTRTSPRRLVGVDDLVPDGRWMLDNKKNVENSPDFFFTICEIFHSPILLDQCTAARVGGGRCGSGDGPGGGLLGRRIERMDPLFPPAAGRPFVLAPPSPPFSARPPVASNAAPRFASNDERRAPPSSSLPGLALASPLARSRHRASRRFGDGFGDGFGEGLGVRGGVSPRFDSFGRGSSFLSRRRDDDEAPPSRG